MTVIRSFKYFAGNEWFSYSNRNFFDSENPTTGEVLARIPDSRNKDVKSALSKSKNF